MDEKIIVFPPSSLGDKFVFIIINITLQLIGIKKKKKVFEYFLLFAKFKLDILTQLPLCWLYRPDIPKILLYLFLLLGNIKDWNLNDYIGSGSSLDSKKKKNLPRLERSHKDFSRFFFKMTYDKKTKS